MIQTSQHTPHQTRQFLAAMCAQAHCQLGAQALLHSPQTAVLAQANTSQQSVMKLLGG
jgi:hypothetical protein